MTRIDGEALLKRLPKVRGRLMPLAIFPARLQKGRESLGRVVAVDRDVPKRRLMQAEVRC